MIDKPSIIGIRLGSAAVTGGFNTEDMDIVAEAIHNKDAI